MADSENAFFTPTLTLPLKGEGITKEPLMQTTIYGFSGTKLTDDEIAFFKEANAFGYILFNRNCKNPQQLQALTDSLRALSGREDLPILIDQEGGRVVRMNPPEWTALPAAECFNHCRDSARAHYLQGRIIANQLQDCGITVNCTPLADIPLTGAHDIIGDRAFGHTAEEVATNARAHAQGLMAGGIYPVLKHIPGHGRAMVDSHEELPVVDASLETLRATDFAPFKALNDLPFGMTAHIIYNALHDEQIATQSPTVIQMIREEIGFDGLLMSDDLSMKAMKGSFTERATLTLQAGCDLLLHCNGQMEEMEAVAKGGAALSETAYRRWDKAKAQLMAAKAHHDKIELVDIQEELAEMLAA
jgi:beta-N-acetylhexosaminidase